MEFNLLLVWLTQTPFKRQVCPQTLDEIFAPKYKKIKWKKKRSARRAPGANKTSNSVYPLRAYNRRLGFAMKFFW
jgi:hypothetical protein